MTSEHVGAGTVETAQRDGIVLLTLLGEHDLATLPELRNAIRGPVASGQGVVVSLTEATFIDSGVTHALYQADAMLREKGRRLVLHVNTASMVRRVLDISGLSSSLACSPSLETALTLAGAREGDPASSTA